MNTIQTIGIGRPEEGSQLLFYIECPDCDTRRGFRVGRTWGALADADGDGMKWETACENCGRRFKVILAWATTPKHWTTRKVEVTGIPVIDNGGLQKQKV